MRSGRTPRSQNYPLRYKAVVHHQECQNNLPAPPIWEPTSSTTHSQTLEQPRESESDVTKSVHFVFDDGQDKADEGKQLFPDSVLASKMLATWNYCEEDSENDDVSPNEEETQDLLEDSHDNFMGLQDSLGMIGDDEDKEGGYEFVDSEGSLQFDPKSLAEQIAKKLEQDDDDKTACTETNTPSTSTSTMYFSIQDLERRNFPSFQSFCNLVVSDKEDDGQVPDSVQGGDDTRSVTRHCKDYEESMSSMSFDPTDQMPDTRGNPSSLTHTKPLKGRSCSKKQIRARRQSRCFSPFSL